MPDFLRSLGLDTPLIQAPMAGVQDSALAVAVSSAGGLGSLPCAMLGAEGMQRELTALRSQTERPYNVNFFCHTPPKPDPTRDTRWRATLAPYYSELGLDPTQQPSGPGRSPFNQEALEVLKAFRPPVVSFHFGLPPEDLLAPMRSWGAKILSSATTLEEALWLQDHGVDVIIAQGLEAGGHRGHFLSDDLTVQLGTFALLPQLVRKVALPVIAAGALVNRRAVQSALTLGASAVQVGTAFLLCPEAHTSEPHRAALNSDAARHTALTNVFSGRPARGIVNRFMREVGPISPVAPEFPLAAAAVAPLRAAAESQGSGDFSPLWAGQNVTGCKAIPAADLVRELTSD